MVTGGHREPYKDRIKEDIFLGVEEDLNSKIFYSVPRQRERKKKIWDLNPAGRIPTKI